MALLGEQSVFATRQRAVQIWRARGAVGIGGITPVTGMRLRAPALMGGKISKTEFEGFLNDLKGMTDATQSRVLAPIAACGPVPTEKAFRSLAFWPSALQFLDVAMPVSPPLLGAGIPEKRVVHDPDQLIEDLATGEIEPDDPQVVAFNDDPHVSHELKGRVRSIKRFLTGRLLSPVPGIPVRAVLQVRPLPRDYIEMMRSVFPHALPGTTAHPPHLMHPFYRMQAVLDPVGTQLPTDMPDMLVHAAGLDTILKIAESRTVQSRAVLSAAGVITSGAADASGTKKDSVGGDSVYASFVKGGGKIPGSVNFYAAIGAATEGSRSAAILMPAGKVPHSVNSSGEAVAPEFKIPEESLIAIEGKAYPWKVGIQVCLLHQKLVRAVKEGKIGEVARLRTEIAQYDESGKSLRPELTSRGVAAPE